MKTTVLLALISIVAAPAFGDEKSGGPANRLAQESSPYLLLHAHNPVDWYPWGPEAFEKAKAENKPIFLSIGYSSCYWCHVMERNVFSDSQIAKYMNANFVNVKVDREERPDVDDIYMTSLIIYNQLVKSGAGGGWPLSMFLTPDGNPIAGATYIGPEDSPERGPGFPTVARRIKDSWQQRAPEIQRTAEMIAEQVQNVTRPGDVSETTELSYDTIKVVVDKIVSLYDEQHGGVDFDARNPRAPRFPNVTRLLLLLDEYEDRGDESLLKIVQHSLRSMANGGIQDHLAGGFHRYSTDRQWKVPHFEKMLYDQAMLLHVYARTAAMTRDVQLANVASEIADFVQRDMTTEQGGFCSAIDAETNAIEGEYYVWSKAEIERILGAQDARLFGVVFGFDEPSTFEHGVVLRLPQSWSQLSETTGLPANELKSRIQILKQKLLTVRNQREAPLLDDKVLTSWNALMIEALAISGKSLKRPQDLKAAETAANFLLNHLRGQDGRLQRTWRNGKPRYAGYLDDYAFTVSALLRLNQVTGNERWLKEATELHAVQMKLFYDSDLRACYYTASDHEKLIARTSTAFDSVFPSGNSVTIRNQLRLAKLDQDSRPVDMAAASLARFTESMKRSPASCSGMARAMNDWLKLNQRRNVSAKRNPRPETSLTRWTDDQQKQTDQKTPNNDDSEVVQHSAFRPVLQTAKPGGFAKTDQPKPLKVKIFPNYKKIPAKGKCLIAIELQVKFGWHINANPSNPDFLVPTTVTLKTDDKLKKKVKLTKIKYPKHHTLKVDGSPDLYHVYDGKQIIYAMLETDGLDPKQAAELEFHVKFQGCNSTQCLPPDSLVMKGKLPVAAVGERPVKANVEKFPKATKPDSKTEKPAKLR